MRVDGRGLILAFLLAGLGGVGAWFGPVNIVYAFMALRSGR